MVGGGEERARPPLDGRTLADGAGKGTGLSLPTGKTVSVGSIGTPGMVGIGGVIGVTAGVAVYALKTGPVQESFQAVGKIRIDLLQFRATSRTLAICR